MKPFVLLMNKNTNEVTRSNAVMVKRVLSFELVMRDERGEGRGGT